MTSRAPTGERWVVLARLVRPQGRHGEILADILTDFPERFADRRRLYLVQSETGEGVVREMALEDHWLHKGRIVLKFARIDSISDAETLRGLMVAIPESERAPLPEDSFYISDLIGCEVVDVSAGGSSVGVVMDFDRDAGLLSVKTEDSNETLIPFAKAYLVRMDLAGKRIEMRLPAGLLDINAPMSDEERREMKRSGGEE
ncbi:MAG TPA: ribosome maturation factor RimM [Acidobacteriaceae bacterium]|nr:ribosome maturation factor RimM [Acidobacteriaceae bacterium]